jgi:uncharacterized protein
MAKSAAKSNSKSETTTRAKTSVATGKTTSNAKTKPEWWADGIRFECQGSGKCCVSHGEYGNVYLTTFDRKRMAKSLKLTTTAFTLKYCDREGDEERYLYRLKDEGSADCQFLKNKQCSVYEGRPEQCRVWPFWPEAMSPKIWKKEVASFCPGIGKGPLISGDTIKKAIEEHSDWEERLVVEARGRKNS